jgi:hypothetical protein
VEKGKKMKDELVALDARAKALEASGYRVLTNKDRVDLSQSLAQMYFHAGRWSGGARDYTAREAYLAWNKREKALVKK